MHSFASLFDEKHFVPTVSWMILGLAVLTLVAALWFVLPHFLVAVLAAVLFGLVFAGNRWLHTQE